MESRVEATAIGTNHQEPIRVFICDDVAELRDLLRAAFLGEPDIRVVGQADNGIAGVMGVKDTQPDVLVLDLSMPEMDGLEAMDTIRLVAPETRIIVFSGFSSEALSAEAARRGASRYLSKGVALSELIAAVREVAGDLAKPPA
jgi:DNA-binding NarL/FixJ family response regulator